LLLGMVNHLHGPIGELAAYVLLADHVACPQTWAKK
jgi:hypothetical protein